MVIGGLRFYYGIKKNLLVQLNKHHVVIGLGFSGQVIDDTIYKLKNSSVKT
jgi:hypothetical protein